MKKILILGADSTSTGGVATVNRMLLQSDRLKKDFVIELLPTWNSDCWTSSFVKALFSLPEKIKDADLIHVDVSSYGSSYRKIILTRLIGNKRYVVQLHSGKFLDFYAKSNWLVKKEIYRMVKNASYVFCVSSSFVEKVQKTFDLAENQIGYVYNGVDVFPHIYLKSDTVNVLYMGTFLKERHIEEFLELSNKFIDESKVKFYVAGSGKQYPWNQYNVQYLGFIQGNKKEEILNNMDILVDDFLESFGIAMVECMNHYVCIVGRNCGAIPEVTNFGECGILFKESNDVQDIIRKLIDDRALLKKYQKAAYKRSFAFTYESFEKEIGKIYADHV